MICPKCRFTFKDPARVKGGKKSRRSLDPETAKKMVESREAKKRKAAKEGAK